MCYRNCEHENWHGECQMGKLPEHFICPGERAYCNRCEAVSYWYDMDESGLCEECIADEIDDTVAEARKEGKEPQFEIEIGGEHVYLSKKEISTAIEVLCKWKDRVAA